MAYFPMFVDIAGKECLVVGGGKVAYRKIKTLLDFEALVHVVAIEPCTEVKDLALVNSSLFIENRAFDPKDINNKMLVIAATNDSECNQSISKACKKNKILVNVVDSKKDSTFIVPSYLKEKNVVAAFSSGGNSPALVQYLKEKNAELVTPLIGDINKCLGDSRQQIIDCYDDESEKREAFKRILEFAIDNNRVPTKEEMSKLVIESQNNK